MPVRPRPPRIRRRAIPLVLTIAALGALLFGAAAPASAAPGCTGGGLSYTCGAGTNATQVQTLLSSAPDGSTITFETGSYTWSSRIRLDDIDGVTLICATAGACTVNIAGGQLYRDTTPVPVTRLMRVSGFRFVGATSYTIWLDPSQPIENLRIDHNTFTDSSGQIALLFSGGSGAGEGEVWGVVDHNTFTGPTSYFAIKLLTGGSTWETDRQGTQRNLFVEDNTFSFGNNDSLASVLDAWMGSSVVFRHNTVVNGRYANHGVCHEGPMNVEFYANTISSPNSLYPNYRNLHFQGSGEEIVFDNMIEGGHFAQLDYRSDVDQLPNGQCTDADVCDGTQTASSQFPDGNRQPIATYRGYPCYRQPGRDEAGTLKPVYQWMNRTETGANVAMSIESGGYIDEHFRANRDYYEGVSTSAQSSPTAPFNGTNGVGFGTLANRPPTCTPTPEALDAGHGGVGYWATDQGEWDANHPGPDGQLYTCRATNTWSVTYRPYSYPHPLAAGTTPDTTPPVISGVVVSGVSASGATVSWSTNESADSQVEFGTALSYGSNSGVDPMLATSHSIALSGLTPNTTYHFRVKSRDASGNLAYSADSTFTTPVSSSSVSAFTPMVPVRALDTRAGLGARAGIVAAGATIDLGVAGVNGVPAGASAVTLNVTVNGATTPGYVTVYPCGTARPTTSNLNYAASSDTANHVTVRIGANGRVCMYTSAPTQLIADLAGYWSQTSTPAIVFSGVTPERLLDSRVGTGMPNRTSRKLAGGETLTLAMTGSAASGVAVALNLTATNVSVPSYLTVYPCGQARPVVSNLNFGVGFDAANLATVRLGASSSVCLYSPVALDVIADLQGYYQSGTASFAATDPSRILDTRVPLGVAAKAPAATGSVTELAVRGGGGVPASATTVLLNLTVTNTTGAGYLTVYPCGSTRPTASNLNFVQGTDRANAVLSVIGAGGRVCIFTSRTTDIVADVFGYMI